MFKKFQSRLFFLRKLRSFNISKNRPYVIVQGNLATVIFCAAFCGVEDKYRINKLINKAGSVIGTAQDNKNQTE